MKKSNLFSVAVTDEMLARINKQAAMWGMSRNSFVNYLIAHGLVDFEGMNQQAEEHNSMERGNVINETK